MTETMPACQEGDDPSAICIPVPPDTPPETPIDPPKKTACGEFVLACYDELSNIPVDLIAFRPTSRWPRAHLTWMIDAALPDSRIPFEDQVAAVADALAVWALETPLTFLRVERDADIVISFAGRDHGDLFPFDGNGGVRAHCFFPGTSRAGQVHLDAEEDWSLAPTPGETDLRSVLVHEIGHALGLEHTPVGCGGEPGGSAIMAPCFDPEGSFEALSAEDVDAIQRLYGDPSGTKTPRKAGEIPLATMPLTTDETPDTDGDGIPDSLEVFVFETDFQQGDTDKDGTSDFDEVFVAGTPPTDSGQDTDGDGLSDSREATIGTRPNQSDTDGDGVNDGEEFFFGTDPLMRDTDGDGLGDDVDPFPTFGGCLFGEDCNENGTIDNCDIRDGTSQDVNNNGIPDECDECLSDRDCDDGTFCNGFERCVDAQCESRNSPCAAGTICDEEIGQCLAAP